MVKISTKINLVINKVEDFELEKKPPDLKPVIRIEGEILFIGKDVSETAIIDTGAHISVLPYDIWKDLGVEILTEHYIIGIFREG